MTNLFQFPLALSVRIVESSSLTRRVQWRFPRSKKRRIRAKWAKRECNVRYDPLMFLFNGTIYAHPQLAKELLSITTAL